MAKLMDVLAVRVDVRQERVCCDDDDRDLYWQCGCQWTDGPLLRSDLVQSETLRGQGHLPDPGQADNTPHRQQHQRERVRSVQVRQ